MSNINNISILTSTLTIINIILLSNHGNESVTKFRLEKKSRI